MRYVLLMIILMVTIPSGMALTSYTHYGMDGYLLDDDDMDDADFTPTFVKDAIVLARPITGSIGLPLVADLNNDGMNEIVVLQTTGLTIYHHTREGAFIPVSGVPFTADPAWDSMNIANIKSTGHTKQVIVYNQHKFKIFEFIGGELIQTTELTFSEIGGMNGHVMTFRCEQRQCLAVHGTQLITSGGKGIAISSFDYYGLFDGNGSAGKSAHLIDSVGAPSFTSHGFCQPHNAHIEYQDLDGDGSKEFIFSYSYLIYSTYWNQLGNTPKVASVKLNASGSIVYHKIHGSTSTYFGSSVNCQTFGAYFTSPVVAELDSSTSGKEIVIGKQHTLDRYHMILWNHASPTSKRYPTIDNAEGHLMSNPIIANVFPDTGYRDFCVFGFNYPNQKLGLVCSSAYTSEWVSSREFYWEDYNYTIGATRSSFARTAHAIQFSTEKIFDNTGVFNPSEFLTTYGIMKIDKYPSSGTFDGTMELVYSWVNGESVPIALDIDNEGYFDIVAVSQSAVYYVDNDFSNKAPYLSSVFIDPYCEGEVWDDDTTLLVRPIVGDPERDQVRMKVVLYSDKTYKRYADGYSDGWSSYVPPNQPLNFLFTSVRPNLKSHLSFHNFNDNSDSGGVGWATSWTGSGYTFSTASSYEGTHSLMVDDNDVAMRNFTLSYPKEDYSGLMMSVYGRGNPIAGAESCDVSYHNGVSWVTLGTISTAQGNNNGNWYLFEKNLSETGLNDKMTIRFKKNGGGSDCFWDLLTISYNETAESTFNQKMTIYYHDMANPLNILEETFYFDVATEGVFRGQGCTTTFLYDDPSGKPPPSVNDSSIFHPDKNAVVKGLDALDELGFGFMGRTAKFMFFMVLILATIAYHGVTQGHSGRQVTFYIGVTFFSMIVFGVMFQIISPALIMIMSILAIGVFILAIQRVTIGGG